MKKCLLAITLCILLASIGLSCSLPDKDDDADRGNVDPGGYGWNKVAGVGDAVCSLTACDPEHVWAACLRVGALFYDGESWKEEFGTEKDVIIAISGLDPDHIWAIGTRSGSTSPKSQIYFFDGEEWKTQYKVEEGLMCIFALDDEHIWAGSSWGSIYLGERYVSNGQEADNQHGNDVKPQETASSLGSMW